MQKTLYIPIDTTLNYEFECPLLVKKYDTLKFKFAIFSLGILQDLNGQTVDLILYKKDGTTIQKTITNTTLNIATIILDKNASACIGEVLGEIVITDAGGQVTSNIFKFNVSNSLTEDIEIKSKDDITTIEDMRALIATYKNEISAIGESTQAVEALNNITTYIDTNLSELTSKNAAAVKNVTDLKKENDRADTNIPGLTNLNDTAEEKLQEFREFDTSNIVTTLRDHGSQLNETVKYTRKLNPILCHNSLWGTPTWQETLENMKKFIDTAKILNLDGIVYTIHLYYNNEILSISDDLDRMLSAMEYAESLNLYNKCIKVHYSYNTDIDLDKFKTDYSQVVQQLLTKFKNKTQYFTVLNELNEVLNDDNNVEYINTLLSLVHDNGFKAGITFQGFYSIVKTSNLILNKCDFLGINYYCKVGFKQEKTSFEDCLNAWNNCNLTPLIDSLKNKYPDKKIIISETGIRNDYIYFANPEEYSYSEVNPSNGETVNKYLRACFETLNNKVDEIWLWYDIDYLSTKEMFSEWLGVNK